MQEARQLPGKPRASDCYGPPHMMCQMACAAACLRAPHTPPAAACCAACAALGDTPHSMQLRAARLQSLVEGAEGGDRSMYSMAAVTRPWHALQTPRAAMMALSQAYDPTGTGYYEGIAGDAETQGDYVAPGGNYDMFGLNSFPGGE